MLRDQRGRPQRPRRAACIGAGMSFSDAARAPRPHHARGGRRDQGHRRCPAQAHRARPRRRHRSSRSCAALYDVIGNDQPLRIPWSAMSSAASQARDPEATPNRPRAARTSGPPRWPMNRTERPLDCNRSRSTPSPRADGGLQRRPSPSRLPAPTGATSVSPRLTNWAGATPGPCRTPARQDRRQKRDAPWWVGDTYRCEWCPGTRIPLAATRRTNRGLPAPVRMTGLRSVRPSPQWCASCRAAPARCGGDRSMAITAVALGPEYRASRAAPRSARSSSTSW